MKKLLKSYLSFTRTERIGLVLLCGLLILLIAIRVSMHLCIHPDFDTEKEKKLVTAWEAFKKKQAIAAIDTGNEEQEKEDDSVVVVQPARHHRGSDTTMPQMEEVTRYKQEK